MIFKADDNLKKIYNGESSGPYTVIEVSPWFFDHENSLDCSESSVVYFEYDRGFYQLPRSRSGNYYDVSYWEENVFCVKMKKTEIKRYDWIIDHE